LPHVVLKRGKRGVERDSNRPVWIKQLFITGGDCKSRTSSPDLLIVVENSFEN